MHRLTDLATRVLVWVGGALLLLAMVLTVGDVIARALFATGYIGLVDVTQFAVIGFAYLGMPFAFWRRQHVAIEMYDHLLGPRSDAILRLLGAALACAVLILLLIYGWTQAMRTLRYGDVSQNAEIPMIAFWALVLSGAALSLLMTAIQALTAVGDLLMRRD